MITRISSTTLKFDHLEQTASLFYDFSKTGIIFYPRHDYLLNGFYDAIPSSVMPGGRRCGAIKKGNDWFFVWSRSDNSGLSASGYLIAV